jgi:hypothetical protein
LLCWFRFSTLLKFQENIYAPIRSNSTKVEKEARLVFGKSYNTVLLLLATGISFPAFCRASDGYSRIGV